MVTIYEDIDDVLGDASTRYFGDAYRRVSYELARRSIDYAATCTARLDGDWSRKGGVAQDPHASTVDAIVLSVRLAENYCKDILGYSESQVAHLYPTHAVIRAGSEPSPLADLPITIRLFEVSVNDDVRKTLVFQATIGNLQVRLTLSEVDGDYSAPLKTDDLPEQTLYAVLLQRRQKYIHNISLSDSEHIGATVEIGDRPTSSPTRFIGLGSAWHDWMQLPELVVILGQLAQVLVYEHDHISRSDSENLWMRRIEISLNPDHPLQVGTPVRLTGQIDSTRDIPLGATVFRTFRVSTSNSYFTCHADIAHALPSCDRLRTGFQMEERLLAA